MRVGECTVCDRIARLRALAATEAEGDRVDGEVTTIEVAA